MAHLETVCGTAERIGTAVENCCSAEIPTNVTLSFSLDDCYTHGTGRRSGMSNKELDSGFSALVPLFHSHKARDSRGQSFSSTFVQEYEELEKKRPILQLFRRASETKQTTAEKEMHPAGH